MPLCVVVTSGGRRVKWRLWALIWTKLTAVIDYFILLTRVIDEKVSCLIKSIRILKYV